MSGASGVLLSARPSPPTLSRALTMAGSRCTFLHILSLSCVVHAFVVACAVAKHLLMVSSLPWMGHVKAPPSMSEFRMLNVVFSGTDSQPPINLMRRPQPSKSSRRILVLVPGVRRHQTVISCLQVWSWEQQKSIAEIDVRANVCTVQWNPISAYELAVGSANHDVHLYDLRRPNQPTFVFKGKNRSDDPMLRLPRTSSTSVGVSDGTQEVYDSYHRAGGEIGCGALHALFFPMCQCSSICNCWTSRLVLWCKISLWKVLRNILKILSVDFV